MSIMPVFFCRVREAGGGRAKQVDGTGPQKEETHGQVRGGCPRGRRKTKGEDKGGGMKPSTGRRTVGTRQVPTEDHQGQRSPTWGQAGTGTQDEPHGPQGRSGEQQEPDRQRREKGERRYFLPQRLPLSVLHAGGEYLGIVANIIAQADEAGFELLGTQRAGVILGPPCARQRAMRCQGGGGREGVGEGGGPCPVEGRRVWETREDACRWREGWRWRGGKGEGK